MSQIDDGGPAFAHSGTPDSPYDGNGDAADAQPGMSLRDWFAGMALQGVLARGSDEEGDQIVNGRRVNHTTAAYLIADAMIAEKRRTENP